MHEILFRGKRIDNMEWVEGDTVLCGYYIASQSYPVLSVFPVIRATVGQYTGLCDKNGTRIFEGDILGFINKYRNMNDTWKCTVEFVEGSFVCRYIEADGDGLYNHFGSWNAPLVEWEVIGNIHDNPELLEATP